VRRMPFVRPTDHYDERISQIDEQICELVKQRREVYSIWISDCNI
jgi:hypothetical protein